MKKIDKVINYFRNLQEEGMMSVPTNNVGGGKIAGTVQAGDDPPVRKKGNNLKRIYMKGMRKWWRQNTQ